MMIGTLKKFIDIASYTELIRLIEGYKKKLMLLTGISVVSSSLGVSTAYFTKEMVDNAVEQNVDRAVFFGVIFAAIILLDIFLEGLESFFYVRFRERFKMNLQSHFLTDIMNKKLGHIWQYSSGDIETRLYDDVEKVVKAVADVFPTIIGLIVELVLAFIVLSFYDWVLALLTFLITPVFLLISFMIGRLIRRIQKNIQDMESIRRGLIGDVLDNLSIIKAYFQEEKVTNAVDSIQETKFGLIKKKNRIRIASNVVLNLGYYLGFFFALAIGSYRLSTGVITFGMMTAFVQLVGRIQRPLTSLIEELPLLIVSFSSLERLKEIESIQSEKNELSRMKYSDLAGVRLENIKFSYDSLAIDGKYKHGKSDHDRQILDDLSFEISVGQKIAIIGESGIGKTTLINVLMGYVDVEDGRYLISEKSGKAYDYTYDDRKLFSLVSQSDMLLKGTIKDNLFVSDQTSESEIKLALKTACCDEFIEELKYGLDTDLYESGQGLSKGQQQRIGIARALLKDSRFLLFDEATSALDDMTEARFLRNLELNYPDRGMVVVTHRDAILDYCDRIYRVENGKLIEDKPGQLV